MQYSSFIPFSYKIGLINCLIHRAFKISSSYLVFHDKINKINNILLKNMYPMFVIDNRIKRFLEIQYTTINNENTINNNKNDILNYRILGLFQTQPKSSLNKFVISIAKTLIL